MVITKRKDNNSDTSLERGTAILGKMFVDRDVVGDGGDGGVAGSTTAKPQVKATQCIDSSIRFILSHSCTVPS